MPTIQIGSSGARIGPELVVKSNLKNLEADQRRAKERIEKGTKMD